MSEHKPQQLKPSAFDHIDSLGYLTPIGEAPVSVPITYENFALFSVYNRVMKRFEAPRQGTQTIVSTVECYVGKYTSDDRPRPSFPLGAFTYSGEFMSFIAHDIAPQKNNGQNGSHQHVITAEPLDRPDSRVKIDVNSLYIIGGLVVPKIWEGDQA